MSFSSSNHPDAPSMLPGRALPLGAHPMRDGVQFSVFSRNATAVSLLIYGDAQAATPSQVIRLDPKINRTGDLWHIFVRGLGAGTLYLYSVDGPYQPEQGMRFNRNRPLIDPYAKAVTGSFRWRLGESTGYDPKAKERDLSFNAKSDAAAIPKAIVIDDDAFDWQSDRPLNYPLRKSVIYEAHVRGLTRHASSGVRHPGTYLGVVEMIPYFKELGITSLELLPLMEFDEYEINRRDPHTGQVLTNYWGYSTMCFFAPRSAYAQTGRMGEQVTEFKTMVRELHKAGIEVIMDVVYNHTGEGNEMGPTYSFRGFDNSIYYMLDENPRYYKNFSGCGNSLNCNHPTVRNMILDSLRYWVMEMHVDGFRFDLGSILGRDQRGRLMENPPILEQIAEDPVLRETKIIAEAWDAGGAYQVGSFPGGRWAEWNDRFRDDARRFWLMGEHHIGPIATRLTGSSDLYLRNGRKPFHSINFITSHDGFTLNDLTSYRVKHNEANGENNTDGGNDNNSCNFGIEGPTDDPVIETLRRRHMKNLMATLFLSIGTPMMLGGDEFGRTQRGNNNAYCQDNELSWFDWRLKESHGDLQRFVKELIHFRRAHPAFMRPEFYRGHDSNYNAIPDITWYNERGKAPDWTLARGLLAFYIDGAEAANAQDREDNDFYTILNSSSDEKVFIIPHARQGRSWHLVMDTSAVSPLDIHTAGSEPLIRPQNRFVTRPGSFVLLLAR